MKSKLGKKIRKKRMLDIEESINELSIKDYSTLEVSHGFMSDGILGGFKASVDKMQYKITTQILLGMLAGFIIGLGYAACIFIVKDLNAQKWVTTAILGIVFPGCILLITFLGGGLYTSHVVATIPLFKGAIGIKKYFKALGSVYLGNLLGTGSVVSLLALTGVFTNFEDGGLFVRTAIEMGVHKMPRIGLLLEQKNEFISDLKASDLFLSVLYTFAAGILCNFLVSSTLPITSSTKNNSAIIIVMFFAVAFFVVSGYQHSPANTFFFWMFIYEGIFDSIDHYSNSGLTIALLFLLVNLIPAAIGNWIGGAILLPGLLYGINKKYVDVLFDKFKLERYIKLKNVLEEKHLKDIKKIKSDI